MAAKLTETKYATVPGSSTDSDGGKIPADGEAFAVSRIILTGSTNCSVMVVWDYGGGDQKIFAVSRMSVVIELDPNDPYNQISGDGVKAFKIIMINDGLATSPNVGGFYEATKI